MMPEAENYNLLNTVRCDILCYLVSARHTLTRDSIILNVVAFYKPECIVSAKALIFKICNETPIKRRPCNKNPNSSVADIEDIYELIEKKESQRFLLPDFVAGSYNSLPPSNFEPLAIVICSLRDEVAALRMEITEIRESSVKDNKAMEDITCVKQDITDIKMKIFNSQVNISPVQSRNTANNENTAALSYASIAASSKSSLPARASNNNVPSTSGNLNRQPQPSRTSTAAGSSNTNQQQRVHRERPAKRRNGVVTGTRSAGGNSSFGGVDRIFDMFVGGCTQESSIVGITDYCRSHNVELKRVEEVETKSSWYNKAYKLSMTFEDREKLLDATLWPRGTFVRKFFRPKVSNANNRETS